jgi:hypothetical protein
VRERRPMLVHADKLRAPSRVDDAAEGRGGGGARQ